MPDLTVRNWSGSLVTTLDPDQLVPSDFSLLENFIYSGTGLPIVRGARRKWNQTQITDGGSPAPVYGLHYFQQGWADLRPAAWVVAQAGGLIVQLTDDGNWTQLWPGTRTRWRHCWSR